MPPTGESLFGFPRTIRETQAWDAREFLGRAWRNQTGAAPEELGTDLASLRRWFNPLATGQRLRREIASLPLLVEVRTPDGLGDPFTLQVGESQYLVTPEGRCLMKLLEDARPSGDRQVTLGSPDETIELLLDVYRSWSQQKLRQVVDLQRGKAAPMLPQALGVILFLLINNSVGEERALKVQTTPREMRLLDLAEGEIVAAFADALAPSSRGRQRSQDMYSLKSGYALTEARRRLGGDLVIDAGKVYLANGSEARVIRRVAEEISRRDAGESARLNDAVNAMVKTYNEHRPVLASLDQAYSASVTIDSVRSKLFQAVAEAGRS